MAALMTGRGVVENDRVAVVADFDIDLPPFLLALLHLKAQAVLLSPRYPSTSLTQRARRAGCRFQWVRPGTNRPAGDLEALTVERNPGFAPDRIDFAPVRAFRPATILFTSGSGGEPNAVVHSYGNHYYNALGSNENIPVGPGDRWLLSLPLYHVGGLGILFRCLLGGGAMVMPDESADMAAQLIRDRVTHLSLVSTQLKRLLQSDRVSEAARLLKAILLGGGPIPKGLIKQAREAGLPVYPTYGMTETASQVATAGRSHPDCLRVLKYSELRIADDGEIFVRGETLASGLADGGWYHTGDIGLVDENGCLIVLGRKDSMFVSGGENIHPESIEQALAAIDGIDEAIVVPVDDFEFGQRPVAFLKCSPAVSLSDAQSEMSEEDRFRLDHRSLNTALEVTLPRFMLPLDYLPWPGAYQPAGIKADREFFAALATKLIRSRK
jgi:O-succinylbenzoic acid--CoA ligase